MAFSQIKFELTKWNLASCWGTSQVDIVRAMLNQTTGNKGFNFFPPSKSLVLNTFTATLDSWMLKTINVFIRITNYKTTPLMYILSIGFLFNATRYITNLASPDLARTVKNYAHKPGVGCSSTPGSITSLGGV